MRNAKRSKAATPRSAREQGMVCAAHGAAVQLDRQGAHRPRTIPNKKREADRQACRRGA